MQGCQFFVIFRHGLHPCLVMAPFQGFYIVLFLNTQLKNSPSTTLRLCEKKTVAKYPIAPTVSKCVFNLCAFAPLQEKAK